jgi:hypothetical protein
MRLLLVTTRSPYPPNDGGGQRSNLLHAALAAQGDLDFVLLADPSRVNADHLAVLRDRFNLVDVLTPTPAGARAPWSALRGLSPGSIDRLAHNLTPRSADYSPDPAIAPAIARRVAQERYDAVVGRYAWSASRAGLPDLNTPTALDIDDLDSAVYRSRLAAGGSLVDRTFNRWHLSQLEQLLPELYRRFDHLWVANPNDAAAIDHPGMSVLPNIPFLTEDQQELPAPTDHGVIGVIASWKHRPNARGLGRFVEQVWPQVRAESPKARLLVFGGGMPDALGSLLRSYEGVEVVGFVEQAREAYARSAFMIAPVYDGAGTKIKVLEALAYQRAIVTTSHAHEGLENELPDNKALLAGSDDNAMARLCVELIRDPARRDLLALEGYKLVHQHFSPTAVRKAVEQGIKAAIARNRDH